MLLKSILKRCTRILSDKTYIRLAFFRRLHRFPDLKDPKTFNEKLQWLKLYNRKPEYTAMVDKYEAKKYVAEKLGEEYIIPTLGVWDRFDDIDFDALPDQFVLKCTHDSGGLVICRDKSKLDREKAKRSIEQSLKNNYFWQCREWPYKNVKPRILAEQYVEDATAVDLPVYKFFCFNGEPKVIQVIQNDKQVNESIDYFDTEWFKLRLRQNYPNSEIPLPAPKTLQTMLRYVAQLSAGHPFLRVDFYEVNGRAYFSEFTFFSDGGTAQFDPPEWDRKLGDWIRLPEKSK